MTAISLSKGQTISLSKAAADRGSTLTSVTVGLGWKANSGLFKSGTYDLDASAFVLDAGGRVLSSDWFVYYGRLRSPGSVVAHSGVDLVGGSGVKDDEQIVIKLNELPREAQRVVIVVNIYEAERKRQSFGKVKKAFMRVVDNRGTELARYDLADEFGRETAVTFGELVRTGNEWQFAAIGQGHVASLGQLARQYGA